MKECLRAWKIKDRETTALEWDGDMKISPCKRKTHKMVKHNETTRRQQPTNCLSVFDHFARLVLKGLIKGA